MKNLMIFLALLFSVSCYTESEIHSQLCNDFPDSFFVEDEFYSVGKIMSGKDIYEFYQNRHLFGNKRMNIKLVVVMNGKIQGFYNQIHEEPVVSGEHLIFPFKEELGNEMDFSDGIPEKVYLDGEYFFFKTL